MMKNLFLLALFLPMLFYSCKPQEKISLEIPWYVKKRVKDDGVYDYNFQDSLKVYSVLNPKNIINKGNYFSYLANLHYKSNPKDSIIIKRLLNQAYQVNPTGFCTELIQPAYQYLKPNDRPHRRYTMPFILDYDLEYFLEKTEECKSCSTYLIDASIDSLDYSHLLLSVSYIFLKDQWYRIPQRTSNPKEQIAFDKSNRKLLDRLYENNSLPKNDKEIRSDLWAVLLHSEDCEWTKKWLDIYMETYRGYTRYTNNLNHFLWRSSCSNEYYRKIIQEEIDKIKTD